MSTSLYIDRGSPVHRLHPVSKLVAMIALFLAAFLSDRPQALLPLVTVATALLWRAGALPNVHRLRHLFAMVGGMAFVVWCLFYRQGPPWLVAGPIVVSREAVAFAVAMSLKLISFLGIGVLFLSTTTIEEFSYALVRLGVPYKFGFTVTLAFRLVPAFVDSAYTVIQAQRSRGFDFDQGGWLARGRRYVPVIVPVFIGALRRADGMAMALDARGFQRRGPRTCYRPHPYGWRDAVAVLGAAGLAAGYLGLWRSGLLGPLVFG